MPDCSNPVQCQMAERLECTCDCGGKNHGKLRHLLANPETTEQGKKELESLKAVQSQIQKNKRTARRQKRTADKKITEEEA